MYGYAAPFYYHSVYYILLIPVVLLSIYAQIKVSSTFKRFSRVPNRRGITGAQAAGAVLRAHGVHDVQIRPCRGSLTDHYDPRDNTIYLSEPVYNAGTVAAVGVAAHEAGHAVQYAVGYGPIRVRAFIIPVTQFGSQFSLIALLLGIVLYSQPLFALGIVLFSLTSVFQLVTLPVEFNASARALRTIDSSFLLEDDERRGAKKVLTAAALTYVAALLMSLVQLLRYLLIFAGRSDRRRQ
ncbi:MAG: zinc metallopeptidase [Oscillospiraceae bacterium]|nr:zinc metallopeptidase [Oscillospiraceae bacterium]